METCESVQRGQAASAGNRSPGIYIMVRCSSSLPGPVPGSRYSWRRRSAKFSQSQRMARLEHFSNYRAFSWL